MSFEVAALPFQAHANYGTWSIDFGLDCFGAIIMRCNNETKKLLCSFFCRQLFRVNIKSIKKNNNF